MSQLTVIELSVPATHRFLNVVGACVAEMLYRLDNIDDVDTVTHDVQLAVHEICTNIVDHAYDEHKKAKGRIGIRLSFEESNGILHVRLVDGGRKFNPDDVAQPRFGEAQERGFGLFLTHQIMDIVKYDRKADENIWFLEKKIC